MYAPVNTAAINQHPHALMDATAAAAAAADFHFHFSYQLIKD